MTAARQPIVVIVEDERELASLYSDWLSDTYTIRLAHSGQQARSVIDESVDVVLLDRRLPSSSGDEVLSWIQDQQIDVRTAMITAVSPDFDVLELGFDTYVVKPVSQDELRDIVSMLLTRTIYDQRVRRYLELLSKRNLLEERKSDRELDENHEYLQLVRELEELRAELDYLMGNLDDDYFESEIRSLLGESPQRVE